MTSLLEFISKVEDVIINPLIALLLALAVLWFVWGLAQFIINSDSDEGRETGRRHMIWGVFGIFVITTVTGILFLLTETFLK